MRVILQKKRISSFFLYCTMFFILNYSRKKIVRLLRPEKNQMYIADIYIFHEFSRYISTDEK